MRSLAKILMSLAVAQVLMALAWSCRTNNGDIGVLYGIWAMESMTVDGDSADIDLEAFYWKFQNDIIQISEQQPYHDHINYTGTWREMGDTLVLNFTHNPGGKLPPCLRLAPLAYDTLTYGVKTPTALLLHYTDSDSVAVVYKLRKLE